MAMFIRVKRKKTTYFLHCDPTETVLEIKQKIQALSDSPVDCQRLILLSTQHVLEDNKTLADQKTVQPKGLEESETPEEDKTHQGLEGLLLEDAKTLAEQQVENDAIVALCLKISDPRVHRIPTLMWPPYIPPTPSPTPTPPDVVEETPSVPGEEPPPAPPPLPPERRMSTELRVPYRQPKKERDSVRGEKEGSIGGVSSKKDGSQKEIVKKEMQEEGGKKEVLKKETVKKETQKEGGKKEVLKKEIAKKDTSKKGGDKNSGKASVGKGGKETPKKGSEKALKEEDSPPAEEMVGPLEDGGVWEDITIDKLTDYSSLVDSD